MMFYNPFYRFRYPPYYSARPYYYPLTPSPEKEEDKPPLPHKDCQKEEEKNRGEEENPFFEIFGIHFYFDDILLICLIFFLYQEGVKDEGLFISLILLLLS